jgi:hypothetical protein
MAARLRLLLVVLVLLVLPSSPAHADQRAPSIRLDYSAPTGCPDRVEFFELVRLRASSVRLVEAGEEARRFSVRLEKDDSEELLYRGRLVKPGKADEVARTLEGTSCDEVARGLALIIAIELGPTESRPAPSSPVAPATARPSRQSARSPQGPRGFDLAVLAGASVGLTSSIGPQAAPTLQAGVELRSMSGPWFLRPSLRLAASVARALEMRDREGTVNATLASALLRVCPLTVPGLGPRLAIEPCATVELGRLFSTGQTPKAELSTDSPWRAVGGAVHVLGWASRAVFLEADLALFAPLDRYRSFLTNPERPLFETPEIGFRWCLGGGVRFP